MAGSRDKQRLRPGSLELVFFSSDFLIVFFLHVFFLVWDFLVFLNKMFAVFWMVLQMHLQIILKGY